MHKGSPASGGGGRYRASVRCVPASGNQKEHGNSNLETWPLIVLNDPKAMANARVCEACPQLGVKSCGRKYCKLDPGTPPNHERLVARLLAGKCPAGRF
ncbi:MAG: hypothetical protein L0Y44_07750 [Phycisphaerales bacterium]|nr:hypothetical protein [Phycisphaerales bacterium]